MLDRYYYAVSPWEKFFMDVYVVGMIIIFVIILLSFLRTKDRSALDLMALFFLPMIWPIVLISWLFDQMPPDRTNYYKPKLQDIVVDDAKREKAPSIIAQMFRNLLSTAMTIILIIVLLFLLIWSLPFLT